MSNAPANANDHTSGGIGTMPPAALLELPQNQMTTARKICRRLVELDEQSFRKLLADREN